MKRILIIVLSVAIIFSFLFWKFGANLFNKQTKQVGPITLTYWGVLEDENTIKPLIVEYQRLHPDVLINYQKQSLTNYRTRVQTQIREGVGPDIFSIHNSWLPMFQSDLASAPESVFTLNDYKSEFYPVVIDSFVKNKAIFASPFEIDGLALFINKQMLTGIGGQPPKNWQEFKDEAVKMTVKDSSGIKTAGAALGCTKNIDNWSDIIGLLLVQQPGVDLNNLASPQVAEILKFYTDFITDPLKKTWDLDLPNSTQMFAEGRLGFYFAPSWRAREIHETNPNLEFEVVAVPQLAGRTVGWASFWGEAVSGKSKNIEEAWKFIKFLTSAETEKLMYNQASQAGFFGEPYSQISLTPELAPDPVMGAFVTQGPIYKFWYLSSNTLDNGINDEMIKVWEDGINATLQGLDLMNVLRTVNAGVGKVLDKYTKPVSVQSP